MILDSKLGPRRFRSILVCNLNLSIIWPIRIRRKLDKDYFTNLHNVWTCDYMLMIESELNCLIKTLKYLRLLLTSRAHFLCCLIFKLKKKNIGLPTEYIENVKTLEMNNPNLPSPLEILEGKIQKT